MENVEAPRLFGDARRPLSAWPERTPLQKLLVILLVLTLLSGFISGMRVSPMIDNMSLPWEIIIFLWGALFGAFCLISTSNLPFSLITKIVLVLGPAFSFVADGSALREAYVFSGSASQITQLTAPITGSSECFGRHSQPQISAEPYPGKVVWIKATRELCEKFEPQNLDGHECVRLDVETGKYGVRRVLAPLAAGAC